MRDGRCVMEKDKVWRLGLEELGPADLPLSNVIVRTDSGCMNKKMVCFWPLALLPLW